jgi:hypothetical protein
MATTTPSSTIAKTGATRKSQHQHRPIARRNEALMALISHTEQEDGSIVRVYEGPDGSRTTATLTRPFTRHHFEVFAQMIETWPERSET